MLGALLDAGAEETAVRRSLETLGIEDWSLEVKQVDKGSIRATRAVVTTKEQRHHRTLADIMNVLDAAALPARVKERALKTFGVLAEGESKVHGRSLSETELHEAGADDALIDVIGACAALTDLNPDRITCSPLPLGGGVIETAHGSLPVPAPAVIEILKDVPVYGKGTTELVTPTGAAILKANVDRFMLTPPMTLRSTGYGAGSRDLQEPNVLRVLVGELMGRQEINTTAGWIVETNIDDMNPELFPYVLERLFEAGAQDAWVAGITMKKGRPAFALTVLCEGAERERILDVIYEETTTLGARISPVAKDELEREWREVTVEGHPIRVKIAKRGSKIVNAMPEHDDAVQAARMTGLPLKQVYRAVEKELGT